MQWTFPVAAGTSTQVRLYFASRSSSTRRFNVLIDGVSKLANYDPNVDPGVNKGTMKSFDVTSDGTVNIDFTHISRQPGDQRDRDRQQLDRARTPTPASVVSFDGTSDQLAEQRAAPRTFDWTNVRGAVMVGRTLFYGQTDGMLYRRSFDGEHFGDPVQVNPYLDPLWNTVETGSGPVGQTYTGVLPTWYTQLSTDHRHVLRQRPDLLHPERPELAVLALVLPRQRRHRRHREHRDRRQHHLEQHQGDVPRRQQPLRRQLDQRAAAQDRLRQRSTDRHLDRGRHDAGLARQGAVPRLRAAQRRAVGRLHLQTARASRAPSTRPARPTATAPSSPTSGRSATATRPAARTRRRTSSTPGRTT